MPRGAEIGEPISPMSQPREHANVQCKNARTNPAHEVVGRIGVLSQSLSC